jgi:hypothetical protein
MREVALRFNGLKGTCLRGLAWAKLNDYYERTDNNHAIYAAATLLHPAT